MKNKHRRQTREKTATLHGGRDRNAAIAAKAMRVKALERLRDPFAEEATRLLVDHGFQGPAVIARNAVDRVLARGGEGLLGIVRGGLVIDEETKAWWASQIEKSIAPFVVESKEVSTVIAKVTEAFVAAPVEGRAAVLSEVRAELARADAGLAAGKERFAQVTGFEYDEIIRVLVEVSRVVTMPPLTSANNVEVAAMGMAYLITRLPRVKYDLDAASKLWLVRAYKEHPKLAKMIGFHADVMLHISEEPESKVLNGFLLAWGRSAYSRLEIGHRLAASFCLTDIPDGFVEAPWEAWSLVVPDGILDDVARVWVVGLEPFLVLGRDGRKHVSTRVEESMIRCLVRTAALALANPDDFKKRRDHGTPTRSTKGRHEGPPDFAQARYMLSAPVEVDLRENVAAALEDERLGRKHASPKVQFLVRGHPRRQAHGPGHALRKDIWIQPFWKGPREAAILLRPHHVERPPDGESR